MLFVSILVVTLVGAVLRLARTPGSQRSAKRVIEIVLLYFLSVQWGFGAMLTALPHIFFPDYGLCVAYGRLGGFRRDA